MSAGRTTDRRQKEPDTMTKFAILGIEDSVTVCDCCGKKNLKCTVAMETEGGDVVHYGRDCASKAMGWGLDATKAERRVRDRMITELKQNAYKTGRPYEQRPATWHGKTMIGYNVVTFHRLTGPVELFYTTVRIPRDNADGWVELIRGGYYYRKLPVAVAA